MSIPKSAFDDMAAGYDDDFSQSSLGRYYRARVQAKMQEYWPDPVHILELNAGTGVDALFLAGLGHKVLATDGAKSMVQVIEHKLLHSKQAVDIETQHLSIENLPQLNTPVFDGLLSNFGGLNCVADWSAMARDTSAQLKNQGVFIMVVMGPWVPWEWLYFLLKGQFKKAFRRLSGQCQWRDMTIYYPSLKQIQASMEPDFELIEKQALGLVMPPSYVALDCNKWPRLSAGLIWLEKKFCKLPGLWQLSDHYLLIYKKRQQASD